MRESLGDVSRTGWALRLEVVTTVGADNPFRLDDTTAGSAGRYKRFLTIGTVLEIEADPLAAVGANRGQFLFLLNGL